MNLNSGDLIKKIEQDTKIFMNNIKKYRLKKTYRMIDIDNMTLFLIMYLSRKIEK